MTLTSDTPRPPLALAVGLLDLRYIPHSKCSKWAPPPRAPHKRAPGRTWDLTDAWYGTVVQLRET
eukprot:2545100-Prymnesium_polylepis.1